MWGTTILAVRTLAAAVVATVTGTTHPRSLVWIIVYRLQHREFAALALHVHCRAYTQAIGVVMCVANLQLGRALPGIHLAERPPAVEPAQMYVVHLLALIRNGINLRRNRITIHKAHIVVINVWRHRKLDQCYRCTTTLPGTLKPAVTITCLADKLSTSPPAACSGPEAAGPECFGDGNGRGLAHRQSPSSVHGYRCPLSPNPYILVALVDERQGARRFRPSFVPRCTPDRR